MENNGRRRRPTPRAIPSRARRVPGIEVAYSVLGVDRVWFTRHAIERMNQRSVTRREVFDVLERPTRKGLRTQPHRQRWRRNRVDVVFERWADRLCIVTVIRL
jgi:hypothetical protein